MNQGTMFLTIKDLQTLMGTQWYTVAAKKHKSIRNKIKKGKRDLTIKEYCDHSDLPYRQTYQALRGEPPPF